MCWKKFTSTYSALLILPLPSLLFKDSKMLLQHSTEETLRRHYVKAIKEGQKVTLHQFQFVAHENNENWFLQFLHVRVCAVCFGFCPMSKRQIQTAPKRIAQPWQKKCPPHSRFRMPPGNIRTAKLNKTRQSHFFRLMEWLHQRLLGAW